MEPEKGVILAVDDEAEVTDLLMDLFSRDYTIIKANSGTEALKKVEQYRPAVVLLDVLMPGTNGYDTCKTIKADPKNSLTKVLLVSALDSEEHRLEGYRSGADDYVIKPYSFDELNAKVGVYLRLYSMEKRLADLNDRLQSEVEIRQKQIIDTQSMVLLGTHSAQVAHNLKSPLTIIQAYANKIVSKKINQSEYASKISNASKRMNDMIQTILTSISEKDHGTNRREPVDLNQLIKDEIELLCIDKFFKEKISKDLKLSDLPPLAAVPVHFSQIFANLIRNATDAMYSTPTKQLTLRSEVKGNQILITIEDTGEGIPKEHMERIFDPLFTTKRASQDPKNESTPSRGTGTGLGLPYCKRILEEEYGGSILVSSEAEKGTAIEIKVPVASDQSN